ncbi:MAG TPA: MoaD/ThiS family protein [Gemmatimonadales bacterium]|nr:MoaD/ThiS family protein [Gemmatimonadales bacterium]
MSITIHLPSVLARLADGSRVLEASGDTLGAAVLDVATRFPSLGERLRDQQGNPYPFVNYFLNDEDARFRGGFEASVRDGDEVTVVPSIAGG